MKSYLENVSFWAFFGEIGRFSDKIGQFFKTKLGDFLTKLGDFLTKRLVTLQVGIVRSV
jgi:ABC-type phosphate/phosphonate transport system permease subunit